MILTWTRCEVLEDRKNEFDQTLTSMKNSFDLPGFCGQVGGWNRSIPSQAILLRVWWDEYSYHLYTDQKGSHEVEGSNLSTSRKTNVFHSELQISGRSQKFRDWITKSKVLRASECLVAVNREQRFAVAEIEVLAPALQNAKGMHGALFSREVGADPLYLVMTFWTNDKSHADYTANTFPKLVDEANLGELLTGLDTSLVEIEPGWIALPAVERTSNQGLSR